MRTKVTDLHPHVWTYGEYNYSGDVSDKVSISIVELPAGTVVAHVVGFGKGFTHLQVNLKGRHYEKEYKKAYSGRFCTTLAKRFMAEVIAKSSKEK